MLKLLVIPPGSFRGRHVSMASFAALALLSGSLVRHSPLGPLATTLQGGQWGVIGSATSNRFHLPANEFSAAVAPLDRKALVAANIAAIVELRAITGSTQSDHDLLAHMRAAELNGQDPAERVRETMAWRLRTGIQEKFSDRSWRQAERSLRRLLKYDYLGADLFGRPVLVERVGAWDVEQVETAAGDSEHFELLNAMVCETLVSIPRPAFARDPRGVVVIMDMEGLGPRHLSAKLLHAFSAVSRTIRAFYPDMLAQVFVVRAPWVFSALQTAVRPLLGGTSLTALRLSMGVPEELVGLGSAWLPAELGGIRKNVFPYDETAALSRQHF